jgi:aminoglycoside phosphotransferase (APT) family kinase protein
MRKRAIEEIAAELGGRVLSAQTLAGGFSHETVLVTLADRRVVARFGGGDPAVEAAVMAAAAPFVPVPDVLLVRPDALVISYVEGTPLGHVLNRGGRPAAMRALGAEVGRVAAAVRSVTLDRRGVFAGTGLAVKAEPPWSAQLAGVAEWCMARVPPDRLDPDTRRRWIEWCARHAPALTVADGHTRLVHADLNPKNILVTATAGGWRVDALLDWEFAYSGSPWADAGNMARFGADYPDGFLAGFADAFEADPYAARVLDMFALSDLVTRAPGHEIADLAAGLIRAWVRDGVPRTLAS